MASFYRRDRWIAAAAFVLLQCFGATIAAAQTSPRLEVGRQIEVRSGGQWYRAVIVDVETEGTYAGLPKVHYEGYGDEFDEYVNPDRIRFVEEAALPQAPANSDQSQNTAESGSGQSPEGRYLCQSFEAGLLHTQGEFILEAGGTYREVMYNEVGSWTYDPATQSLEFTGILDNGGKATFYPDEYKGRPRKGVVAFDWGNGVVRECYRSTGK